MADKSKNFGNKVANFGKKFVGGLLFDDLPEALRGIRSRQT